MSKKSIKVIPPSIKNKIGKLSVDKGTWRGIPLVLWDFTQECDRSRCMIADYCPYETLKVKSSKNTKEQKYIYKCVLHAKYLRSVLSAALNKLDDKTMTMENSVKLGYHLIPLYNQLFKFKLVEYGMQHEPVLEQSERGGLKINPIFKEIRDTISAVDKVWKSIGRLTGKPPNPDMGDGEFIEALFGDEESGFNDEEEADTDEGTGFDFDEVPEPKLPKKRSKNDKRTWSGNGDQPGVRNKSAARSASSVIKGIKSMKGKVRDYKAGQFKQKRVRTT